MKEKLLKLLEAKQEQRNTLNKSMIESESKEERAAIGETLASLGKEIADVEAMLKEVDEPAEPAAEGDNPTGEGRQMNILATLEAKKEDRTETRAKRFVETSRMTLDTKESRAVLVSGGKVATPTEVKGINDLFNQVSSIVDMVNVVDCSGMGTNRVAYLTSGSTAATQTEGAAYNASEPTFDFVDITPQTEAIIGYVSKQVRKQTPLQYAAKVQSEALTALRKRASKLIVDKIIASTLNDTVSATVTATKGVIDEKTLRNIVFAYGGDENVQSDACLFLNKTDLIAFGDVRGTNEKKAVYEIIPDGSNPNTGVIKDGGLSVKYCINSNITACSGTSQTTSAVKTMFYGDPLNCELDLFSDYEIAVSEDYEFAKGLLSIRGDVELGAAVVKKGGFVVLTIAATA